MNARVDVGLATPQSAGWTSASLRAIVYKLLSAVLLACMFGLVKTLGAHYPIGEIVFSRSLFALLPILWVIYRRKQWRALQTKHPMAHLQRAVAGIASLFLSFGAVSMLPLSTATSITYAAPMFITVLSAIALKERVHAMRWAVVVAGFAGVLIVVHPDFTTGLALGKIVGILAALATAMALISIRQMAATESDLSIAFYFTVFGAIVGAITLPFVAAMPTPIDALRFVAIGVLGGTAQILLTKAYRLAPASLIAPFEYATLLSAVLIGIVFWNESPSAIEFLGIVVIVGSNVLLAVYENANGLRRILAGWSR
jgi:drug/metabolite transporter (DMT)-like permease